MHEGAHPDSRDANDASHGNAPKRDAIDAPGRTEIDAPKVSLRRCCGPEPAIAAFVTRPSLGGGAPLARDTRDRPLAAPQHADADCACAERPQADGVCRNDHRPTRPKDQARPRPRGEKRAPSSRLVRGWKMRPQDTTLKHG